MYRLVLLCSVLALMCTLTPVRGAALTEMPEVYCDATNRVTLEVKETRLNAGDVSFTTRLYHYNGVPSFPGPTIVMTPGEPCQVTIKNSLSSTSAVATCTHGGNGFHCPDTTNLHTHGLHVSQREDDVSTSVLPGKELTYTYHTFSSHVHGTHWYHAHHHGATALQVFGGLAGSIIMNAHSSYQWPSDLKPFYQKGNYKLLQLGHIWFSGGDAANSEAFTFLDYNGISSAFSTQTINPNPSYANANNKNYYVVNGQYQPELSMPATQAMLLRFVHASGARLVGLEIDGSTSHSCTMTLVARDGVPQYTPYLKLTGVALIPGTRSDVVLSCAASDAGKTLIIKAGTATLLQSFGQLENIHEQAKVFTIKLTSDSPPTGAPTSPPSDTQAPLPSYLNDLRSATTTASGTSTLQLTFGGGVASINGVSFKGFTEPVATRYTDAMCLNKVYEYTVQPPGPPTGDTGAGAGAGSGGGGAPPTGGGPPPRTRLLSHSADGMGTDGSLHTLQGVTGAHPYHQHVNHFQIINPNLQSTSGQVVRTGEWRDVAPVVAPTGFVMRVRPVDFTGDTVLHCHYLEHEDKGMMALFNINNCGDSSTNNEPIVTSPSATVRDISNDASSFGGTGGSTAPNSAGSPTASPSGNAASVTHAGVVMTMLLAWLVIVMLVL